MLIDAAHPEETRVAVIDGNKLDKYDFTSSANVQIKGNIYLGKIVKVEPSLQAAFVDFGGNKHGFLSFTEIHHDYFQIPIGDREELKARIQEAMAARSEESKDKDADDEIDSREISRLRYQFYRRYKIQEVIKKRQIVLVQATKEARGVKGAALTTYISLAGRYCVLMPNMAKGNGISRKISNPKDRQKMKKIVSELDIENGSTVIRTAGVGHTKPEIKKDFEYLKNLWDEIRDKTLHSMAPSLIYEEANIIKRAIRDFYTREIESIVVDGDQGYKFTKELVKKLIPSHAKKVKLYEDKKLPLFSKYRINEQVNQIYSTRVDLPSGGYLVINTTEALVSIDVNSGKATRARDISGTAIKTNLEAAVEIARQCRLRDLAGLIVVDFIDMDEKRDNVQVERCLRDALRDDKARIQVGPISNFGLLEFSRQRLRSSIADTNMVCCPHCNGTGVIWSDESIALQILRKIEETCMAVDLSEVSVTLSTEVALYLLNNKKDFIRSIEQRGLRVRFAIDPAMATADFKITRVERVINSESSRNEEDDFDTKETGKYEEVGDKKGKQSFFKSSQRSFGANSQQDRKLQQFDNEDDSNNATSSDDASDAVNSEADGKKQHKQDKWLGKNSKKRNPAFSKRNKYETTNNNADSENDHDNISAMSTSESSEISEVQSSDPKSMESENSAETSTYNFSKRKGPKKKGNSSVRTQEQADNKESRGDSDKVVFDIPHNGRRTKTQSENIKIKENREKRAVYNIESKSIDSSSTVEEKDQKEKKPKQIKKVQQSSTTSSENSSVSANKSNSGLPSNNNVSKMIETYKEVENVLQVASLQNSSLITPLAKKEKKSGWWQKLLKPTENPEKK